MKGPVKILFVCSHNSARSQMAEAYFNSLYQGDVVAESAGLEAGTLNPFVVSVMGEDGIDISANKTDDVFEIFKEGRLYLYVITVCSTESADKCPLFPGVAERVHWTFDDPSQFEGTEEEILTRTRIVRDQIKEAVKAFITEKISTRNRLFLKRIGTA